MEDTNEDYADNTALLSSAPVGRLGRSLRAGTAVVGLVVVIVVVVARTARSSQVAVTQSTFVQAWSLPPECHIDGNASEVIDYSPWVCMQFTEGGVKQHSTMMPDIAACEEAKKTPGISDVVCCQDNKCGGDAEKEDVKCYVDGTSGGLATAYFIRYPLAGGLLCSKFTRNDGFKGHQPVSKETCDASKQAVDKNETWSAGTKLYWNTDFICCTTDYCNGDGSASDP